MPKESKQKAYLLTFDGLADWEAAHALCEINNSGRFEIVTVGFNNDSITSMGGLKISPDVSLSNVRASDAAIFIMPGGDMWERASSTDLIQLINDLQSRNVPVAAICGATLEIARAGLTRNIRHTSNAKTYLKSLVPDYNDDEFYVDELAIRDQNLITASGLGSVEFAREIIKQLQIYNDVDTERWFRMFKHGVFEQESS